MTDEHSEDRAPDALSGFALQAAGRDLRRQVLNAAHAEWDRRGREQRQLWRTARNMALAVAAVLVVAFIVDDIDGRMTAAIRPRPLTMARRQAAPQADQEWLSELGVATPLRQRMVAAAGRRRGPAFAAQRVLLEELTQNGG
jgi:hypothetical protein